MKKKSNLTNILILILFILAILTGYNYFARPFLRNFPSQQGQEVAQQETEAEVQEYVQQKLNLLDSLSSKQKVAQLMAYPTTIGALEAEKASTDSANLSLTASASTGIQELEPGLITLFGSSISQESASTHIRDIAELFAAEPITPLIAVDHEGGDVQRLSGDGFTQLPAWETVCASDEQERIALLKESAQELSQLGVSIVYAPVLDIDSSVLTSRSCVGYDQTKLAAKNYIETFGSYQIMSVIKHFPGLGNTTKDLHFSEEAIVLGDGDTRIFSEILSEYSNMGVMISHVKLDGLLDGVPCSLSEECLSAFPKDFPFTLIFTDSLNMGSLDNFGKMLVEEFEFLTLSKQEVEDDPETAKLAALSYQALMAGNDVLVYGKDVGPKQLIVVRDELAARLEQDEELAQKVEASVAKILAVKKLNDGD